MKQKFILLAILALCVTTECIAWGQKGHDVTCAIAEKHLTRKARRHIQKVLDGKSIVYWANWLDNASHQQEYAYSKTWHYKNVNAGQAYNQVKPVETGDVVTAINEQVSKLQSGKLSQQQEALALKILIHLAGDIHQPMHLGHQTDLGGNQIHVKFFDKDTDLHAVWDTDLVESVHNWAYSEWAEQIDRLNHKERKILGQGRADDWACETHVLATAIYDETPEGSTISYDYVATHATLIEQQLVKGGLRLAKLLNEIYR